MRSICIITGTRADYGLLQPLMRAIAADPDLKLQVIATGMHLSAEFGLTCQVIESDGIHIDARVDMLLCADTPQGIARSMGVGLSGIADALGQLQPDIVVVLGDRFEALAAAQAALLARIPLAHIHGGELSEGAVDESMRHAITKLAHWHFVAAEPYRKRVIQLGEAPGSVHDFGAPGLDHLSTIQWLDRPMLESSLGMALKPAVFLVTYHPATLGALEPLTAQAELLAALDEFPDATVVLTAPNADAGGRALAGALDAWVAANAQRAKLFASLGTQRYLSLMRIADVVIGNSSSALIEAPALKCAAVNIGDRQHGRLKASSVLDASEDRAAIVAAIARGLSSEFRATLPGTRSLYGAGCASGRIKDVLKSAPLKLRKRFFDVEHGY